MKRLLSTGIFLILSFHLAAQPSQKATNLFSSMGLPAISVQEQQIQQALQSSSPLQAHQLEEVYQTIQRTEQVDACTLVSFLNQEDYMTRLTLDQAEDWAIAFSRISNDTPACGKYLLYLLSQRIKNTPISNEKMLSFYAMAMVSLGHHPFYWREVEDWAFTQVQLASQKADKAQAGIWPATVLLALSAEAFPGDWPWIMDDFRRTKFERRLEGLISQFDWIQNQSTDYVMTDVKSNRFWNLSNQSALISLFSQANNFFAYKEDDPFIKSLITTGGFKELVRLGRSGDMEMAHALRFSNDGETFYLSHPTPGTDGKGHFVDSVNGYRHQILSQLVQALCVSYVTRGKEGSDLIEQFTRRYLAVNADGKFTHYLYIPLQSMRSGRELLENFSLEGWKSNEQSLQKELYAKLKKGYPSSVVCSSIQGACEVAFEWGLVGELFHAVGAGLKLGAKASGKALMKVLPIGTMLDIAALDIASRQAVRFCQAGMHRFLQAHGWKIAVAGTIGVGMQSDTPNRTNKSAR